MTLKQQILADAVSVFTNLDEFAESVVYRNRQSKVIPVTRTIKAVVIRLGTIESAESGGASTPAFEVHVANSATTGISSTELDLGGDTIELSVRPGMAASRRAIIDITDLDEGMMVLQCR